MPELPKKKVGIISCSGEELTEGTISRLAALKVLHELRPSDTVTICLPLFLAGGEGDRAFARYYPTIAVDGCELRCAARATEMYSSKPAAVVMVRDVMAEADIEAVAGRRRLNEAGQAAVEAAAKRIAAEVDRLRGNAWNRVSGSFIDLGKMETVSQKGNGQETPVACSCGSGIPVQIVEVNGQEVTLIALPLIFERFRQEGKRPSEKTSTELLEMVRIYNPVPENETGLYREAIGEEYRSFYGKEATH